MGSLSHEIKITSMTSIESRKAIGMDSQNMARAMKGGLYSIMKDKAIILNLAQMIDLEGHRIK